MSCGLLYIFLLLRILDQGIQWFGKNLQFFVFGEWEHRNQMVSIQKCLQKDFLLFDSFCLAKVIF